MNGALTKQEQYKLAMNAGQDAGNAHARANGRDVWDESDWNEACKVTDKQLSQGVQQ